MNDSEHFGEPRGLEVRPYMLAAIALREWRWTILFPLAATVLTLAFVLIVPPRYTATALMLPESRADKTGAASLAGVAAQFGLSIGGMGSQSPQLYVDLVKSRTVLDTLLAHPMPGPASGPHARFIDWLDRGGKNGPDSLYIARDFLAKRVNAELTRETGVVKLEVTLRDPVVAAMAAGWVLDEINRFNAYRRQTTAHVRRQFLEGRIKEMEETLGAEEGDFRRFLESNRTYESSPSLRFQARRLENRVTLINEVLSSLRRDFESARIDEVNDTPVLTIIDAPRVPERKSFPKRALILLATAAGSTVLGLVLGYAAHTFRHLGTTDPTGRQDLAAAWGALRRRRLSTEKKRSA